MIARLQEKVSVLDWTHLPPEPSCQKPTKCCVLTCYSPKHYFRICSLYCGHKYRLFTITDYSLWLFDATLVCYSEEFYHVTLIIYYSRLRKREVVWTTSLPAATDGGGGGGLNNLLLIRIPPAEPIYPGVNGWRQRSFQGLE